MQIARSNSDDAYQLIRRLIVTAEMPPGIPFTENEIGARVGFGKTPVREALLRLKLEKLVGVQPRAGYRVAPVTLKDVRDTCRLLALLEGRTAERAAENPSVAARLAPVQEQVELALESDPIAHPDEWIRADWMFHLELARCQDNHLQNEALTRLHQAVMRFRYLALKLGARTTAIPHSHAGLLDAFATGDAAGARTATEACWSAGETDLVSLLSASQSVESTNVWGVRDDNPFYLDAVPAGPALLEAFEAKPSSEASRPDSEASRPDSETPIPDLAMSLEETNS